MESRVLTKSEKETLDCMRELLRSIPALQKRYSPRTILKAMLAQAAIGMRDQLAIGAFTRSEINLYCRELRAGALDKSAGKSSRRSRSAPVVGHRSPNSKTKRPTRS